LITPDQPEGFVAPMSGRFDAGQMIADQPGLPRALLIGDSISIGYTVTVFGVTFRS
jgi:hypothetical protein